MSVRLALLSTAHLHAHSYARCAKRHLVGVWDDDAARGAEFAKNHGLPFFSDREELLSLCDAVIVTSENAKHLENCQAAAHHGKHILCEKPIISSEEQAEPMLTIASKVLVMTAFPCRFSPAYKRLKEKITNRDIGRVLAICATNHGMCPFGWFVQKELSGGGAMMDHTVHVADLLRDLLGRDPTRVYAQTANRIYGQEWDDSALLHLTYEEGVFATIDASWSRPSNYKTWGDVKMNVVGEKGVIEVDLFAQAFDHYSAAHGVASFGSDLDALMVSAFLKAVERGVQPPVTATDGIAAARVAFAGYKSASMSKPVTA